MIPSQAFYSDDPADTNPFFSGLQCPVPFGQSVFGGSEFQARTTIGTRIRLGVEAPILRIEVLLFTLRTHQEFLHAGSGAIIGKAVDDGEAWATMGAVGERISMASIEGGENLASALAASGKIRKNPNSRWALGLAGSDFERLVTCQGKKTLI
jgi:hypothetical protein